MHHSTRARSALLSLPLALLGCGSEPGDDTGTDAGGATQITTATQTGTGSTGAPTTTEGSGSGDLTGSTSVAPTTGETEGASVTDASTGSTTGSTTEPVTTGDSDTSDTDVDTTTGGSGLWDTPNLWYSVDKALVYIEISPMDGSVVQLVHNELVPDQPLWNGQNGLTMLEDGTLLGSRESDAGTQIYHIPEPPITADTPAMAVLLGTVPSDKGTPVRVEALYTDCDGRIYLMDTGVDTSSADGNRLLRFNAAYLEGELTFDVITDLGKASVADIDDMSPAIVEGEITDGIGFAMDSSNLWRIDYTTGTGMQLAKTGGSWGVHALGGPLFKDMAARLYILGTDAELMEVHLDDYSNTAPLIVGPDLMLQTGYDGWSGLAGPLTECMTTIPQ